MEIKFGDNEGGAACVVHAGDDGVLRPVELAKIEETKFVRRQGAGLGCVTCHGSGSNAFNPKDLVDHTELSNIEKLRDAQVHGLAAATWSSIDAPDAP